MAFVHQKALENVPGVAVEDVLPPPLGSWVVHSSGPRQQFKEFIMKKLIYRNLKSFISQQIVSIVIIFTACIFLFLGIYLLRFTKSNEDLAASLAPEFIGIGITILFIDTLYNYRTSQQEKKVLLRQLASSNNSAAADAWHIVKGLGWFRSGILQGIDLSGANLRYLVLCNAKLDRANFTGADLSNANLSPARIAKSANGELMWSGSDSEAASLEDAKLVSANLQGAELFLANLQKANLFNAILKGASLRQAKLGGAFLLGADLENANLQDADLSGVKYNAKTRWPDGFIIPQDAINVDLIVSGIANTADNQQAKNALALARRLNLFDEPLHFQKSQFPNAALEGADFSGLYLSIINFAGANLRKANFTGANIRGCDFRGANLDEANFADALYNTSSKWPINFIPEDHGAIRG